MKVRLKLEGSGNQGVFLLENQPSNRYQGFVNALLLEESADETIDTSGASEELLRRVHRGASFSPARSWRTRN